MAWMYCIYFAFLYMCQYSDEKQITLKSLRDLLNKYPDSRCAKSSDCMSMMTRQNSRTVYGLVRTWMNGERMKLNVGNTDETNWHIFPRFPKPYEIALDAVIADHERTGQCNLQLAKKDFLSVITALMLPKDTPYKKSIAIG